jgi:hypothetical protein
MSEETKTRTPQQNKCMHGWLTSVAKTLDDAGLDIRRTMKIEFELPWTGVAAKEYLWKPIQKVIANVDSTADASTKEYQLISEIITRQMAQSHGVQLPPWPTQQNGGGKDNGYE